VIFKARLPRSRAFLHCKKYHGLQTQEQASEAQGQGASSGRRYPVLPDIKGDAASFRLPESSFAPAASSIMHCQTYIG
jgi:hypothetical protein